MRIATIQIHQQGLNNILKQQSILSAAQTKIASGKRILTPSDDPIGTAQILQLNQQINMTDRFKANADSATGHLELAESVLDSTGTIIQRVRELQIRASSDSLGDLDRQSIARELQEQLEAMVGLANSQDATGAYLFSGYQTATIPFTKDGQGNYVYGGDDGQRIVEVSEGLKVPISDSGFDVFVNIPDGNRTFSVVDPGAANTGSGIVGATSVTDAAAYVADTYTISFVTNGSSQLAYQVIGATSGQVIPAPPLTIPTDAPAYVEGQSIVFNGVSIPVTGTPAVGDNFEARPSKGQSAFATIQKIINALDKPSVTPSQKAAMRNDLNQSLAELDNTLDAISVARIKLGARLNNIDTAQEVNDNFLLHSRAALSKVEDLDFAQAISEFEARASALEAAQQTFIRIRRINIFNFLG